MDALFTRLYERHGSRFIVGHLVGVYLLVALIGVLGGWLFGRLAQFSVIHTVWAGAVGEGSLAIPIAWATWAVRDDIRVMMRWASRDHPDDEQGRATLIEAVYGFSPRFAIACLWRVMLLAPPTVIVLFGLGRRHGGTGYAIAIGFASLMLILYGGLAGAFLGQLSLRPLRREVGRSLTREEFAPIRSLSVATKVRLGFVAALFVISTVIVAVTLPAGSSSSALNRAIGEVVLVVATLGLALALPVTQNALDPVRDLIEGTHRVAAGDLSAQVPVTSTDELGELAASFNEMIEGLRERESLRKELQESRARIVAAADQARRQVERDLHDGAQQRLVLIGLKLGLARRQLKTEPSDAAKLIDELQADLDSGLVELRDLAHGIYPAALENEGLQGALRETAELAAIPASVECDGLHRYRPELEAAVYFCCLEALQNAAKHAGGGARVEVQLNESGQRLRFEISDDGAGFDPAGAADSSGLQNMRDRVGALGGELVIDAGPGRGTTVVGTVPLDGHDIRNPDANSSRSLLLTPPGASR